MFRSWAWQRTWWKHFGAGKELRILAARDDAERLVGLAPLCLSGEGRVVPNRSLLFLGTERVSSEYLDIIVDPEAEDATAIALLSSVMELGNWQVLALTDLLPDATALRCWLPELRRRGFFVELKPCQECPYILLPRSLVDLRQAMSHSLRGAVSRAARKLSNSGYSYRQEVDPSALPNTLEHLYDLHAARWAARNRPGNFVDERVRRFHRDLAPTLGPDGGMRLGILRNGPRVIGVLYALEQSGTVSYYQSGFDPSLPHPSLRSTTYSPGLVLIDAAIEDAIQRKQCEFDFLRGNEAYKRRWPTTLRRTWSVTAIRPEAWYARGHHHMKRWVQRSRSRVKQLVPGREQDD